MMMKLRDKIADIIACDDAIDMSSEYMDLDKETQRIADAILALPEIRQAIKEFLEKKCF